MRQDTAEHVRVKRAGLPRGDELMSQKSETILHVEPVSRGKTIPLEHARARVREHLAHDASARIRVELGDGVYRCAKTLVFGPEDCAREGGQVTWAAAPGARPVLTAAAPLEDWRAVTNFAPEIPEAVRGRVFECPIPALSGGARAPKVLFLGGEARPAVRGPGFAPTLYETFEECRDDMEGYRNGPFDLLDFPEGQMRRWSNLPDVELRVRPTWAWILNILPLAEVDERRRVARTAISATYPMRQQVLGEAFHLGPESCWVLNSYAHLAKPGDWVADSRRGMITMVTDGTPPRAVEIPLGVELLRVEGSASSSVSHLRFEGLAFTGGDRYTFRPEDIGLQHDWDLYLAPNALVRLQGVENIGFVGCRFSEAGGTGLRVDGGARGVEIADCLFSHLGGTGVLLCGTGPGHSDVNGGHTLRGNTIHAIGGHYSGSPGIFIWQSGNNVISGNTLHGLPYNGIVISGVRTPFLIEATQGVLELFGTVNREAIAADVARLRAWLSRHPADERAMVGSYEAHCFFEHWMTARGNLVEGNEIFDVMRELADGNAIYLTAAGRDNVIRGNFLHDIVSLAGEPIRCDGQQYWTTIENNLILRSSGSIQLRNACTARCNYIIDEVRHPESEHPATELPSITVLREILGCGCGYLPSHLHSPVDVLVEKNVFYQSTGLVTEPKRGFHTQDLPEQRLMGLAYDRNIFWAPGDAAGLESAVEARRATGRDTHSMVLDPGFEDPDRGDYRLRADSALHQYEIAPPPRKHT